MLRQKARIGLYYTITTGQIQEIFAENHSKTSYPTPKVTVTQYILIGLHLPSIISCNMQAALSQIYKNTPYYSGKKGGYIKAYVLNWRKD